MSVTVWFLILNFYRSDVIIPIPYPTKVACEQAFIQSRPFNQDGETRKYYMSANCIPVPKETAP